MSTKDNASEAPPEDLAPSVPLAELYEGDFENKLKGKATFWKNYLNKEVKAQVFENAKYKKFLEKSGIRAKWEEKMEQAGDYENYDIGTLQDVVKLHSDYAEFKKDMKQTEVWEKKVALMAKKDEMKSATEDIGEAMVKVEELNKALEEMMKASEELGKTTTKIVELRDKIADLQEEIDQLDKELYEARESRKDEDRHLVKKLKEYLSEIRLPELPPADDKSATPPLSPISDVDSEFSRKSGPKKPAKKEEPPKKEPPKKEAPKKNPPKEVTKEDPPKKKGKKAPTVEDASD